ncbi:MAG: hypothetical protein ABR612_05505 [Chromatocurvus sp.]
MNPYLRFFAVSVATVFLITATLNFALDPLGYFRTKGWHDGTFVGNRMWADERLAFNLSIDNYRPDTLIAGTSRVRQGFALDDQQLPAQLGKTLRLGVSGARFRELDYYIRRLLSSSTPRNLLIGLDLGQFLRGERPPVGGHKPRPDEVQANSARTLMTALWSRGAFRASVGTLFIMHRMKLDGSANTGIMQRRLNGVGHRQLTRNVERGMAKRPPIFNSDVYDMQMETLDTLLAKVCLAQINVRLFISPIHIRQLILLRETANRGLFSAWKIALADMVDTYRTQDCRVTLTDFSAISAYTSEPFPEPGDTQQQMQLYWESSHYTPRMGRMIIDRLLEENASKHDFGADLTRDNIAEFLDREQHKLEMLIHNQPELIREISELAR